MTKPRSIGVEAMWGMNRKQVKLTNVVANCLVSEHHMCLDCAIDTATAFVWSRDPKHPRTQTELCSEACGAALTEFFEDTLGSKAKLIPISEMPGRAH